MIDRARRALVALVDACFAVHARLFVLLCCLIAMAIGAAVAEQSFLLWICVAVGIICGATRRSWSAAFVLASLPFLAYGYAQWRLQAFERADIANLSNLSRVIFTGRVLHVDAAYAIPAGPSHEAGIKLEVAVLKVIGPRRTNHQGTVLVNLKQSDLKAGDLVIVRGKLKRPKIALHRWEFDYAAYLRRRGILSTLYAGDDFSVRRIPASQRPDDLASVLITRLYLLCESVDRMRTIIMLAHRRTLGVERGDLLSSIVIGNRTVKPAPKLIDEFRNVGLSHLLAASGFNLTIVTASLVWFCARVCRFDAVVNLVALSGIVVFVLLAGASASVTRAAIMCTLVLAAHSLYRTPYTMAILSLALVATCVCDPLALSDIGLQLSYLAATGIVLTCAAITERLIAFRFPKLVAECLAVIVSAQIWVLPLLLFYFWQVGTTFLVVNLIVAPMVAPLTVLGFLSSLSAALEPHSAWFLPITAGVDFVAGWLLDFLLGVAHFFSEHKSAKLVTGPPLSLAIVFYYLALPALVLSLRLRRGGRLMSGLFALACLLLFWRPPLPPVTVTKFSTCTVELHADRKAIVKGRLSAPACRYLLYHGVDIATGVTLEPQRAVTE